MPRFFVPDARAGLPVVALSATDVHHLTHVLRLGVGGEVAVFDGQGREWTGRVASVSKRAAAVELLHEAVPAAEPPVRVTLGAAVLKASQMDAVVRDATMLGVAAIVPMTTDHVATTRRATSGDGITRWQRIAAASASQCGRAVVPAIAEITPFAKLLAGRAFDTTVMTVEPMHGLAADLASARPSTALLLVGPEGGWSRAEIDHAMGQGAELLHLGSRTLRAETAPTVALTALWMKWGWE